MPTSKQRRDAARRHLERQLARREQRNARRRTATLISTVAGVVVVFGVVITSIVMLTHDNKTTTTSPTASAAPTSTAVSPYAIAAKKAPAKTGLKVTKTTGPCGYSQTAEDIANTNTFNIGLPADPAKTPATGTQTVKLMTTRGEIDIQLNRADAPCAVQSWDFLLKQHFYDQTPCHRLTTLGLFVLQCGDPTGTGQGGTTYRYKEENLAKVNYGAGVVAMAKQTAAGTTGSQFFIVYQDSNASLEKKYSVVGKVTKGLDIITAIAKDGVGPDQTAPLDPIGIKSATVSG